MRLRPIRLTVGAMPIGEAYTWSYPHGDGKIYVIPTYQLTVNGTSKVGTTVKLDFEVLRFGIHRTVANPTPRTVGISSLHTYTIRRWIPTYRVHSASSRENGAWQVHGNFLIHDGPDYPKSQLYATAGCLEVCGGPNGFVLFNKYLVDLSGTKKIGLNEQLAEVGASGCISITYLPAEYPPVKVR